MSVVTNIILSVPIIEGREKARWLAGLNKWLSDRKQPPMKIFPDEACTGTKRLEVSLCVGAYNHLPVEEFKEFVRSLPWGNPDWVQLFIMEQEERKFSEVFDAGESAKGR